MAKSVLLIGLGEFGQHVAKKLNELDIDVMAVDRNEKKVDAIMPYVTDALIGDSTNEEFLVSLGLNNYDVCIVAIGDNFQNSLETVYLISKNSNIEIIARANADIHQKFLEQHGASKVIYPEGQMAEWLAIDLAYDNIFNYIGIDDSHSILDVEIPSSWDDKTLSQLDTRNKYGINILGIANNNSVDTDVKYDTVLKKGQRLLVLGKKNDIEKVFKVKI